MNLIDIFIILIVIAYSLTLIYKKLNEKKLVKKGKLSPCHGCPYANRCNVKICNINNTKTIIKQ